MCQCDFFCASLAVISLDPGVTAGAQAVYPRLLARRISARLLFHLAPRRDCPVSPQPLHARAGLVSVALIRPDSSSRDGHYPLRYPPEPGLSSPAASLREAKHGGSHIPPPKSIKELLSLPPLPRAYPRRRFLRAGYSL